MSRRATVGPRWKSKFARFVRSFGVCPLAKELNVPHTAIYQWIRAMTRPKPEYAAIIQRLARERGTRLTFDDIYGHSSHLRAIDHTIAIEIGERKVETLCRATSSSRRRSAGIASRKHPRSDAVL
jgi:hypothetical protein